MPNRSVIIPAEEMEIDDEIVKFNETILDPMGWVNGGVSLDNTSGFFVVEPKDLKTAKRLNVIFLRIKDPKTHSTQIKSQSSLEHMGATTANSEIYRFQVEPQWVK
jgi:hypothetical protein